MGVYGVPLPDDGSSFVPPLVLTCIAWIEEHAITAEGVWRVAGDSGLTSEYQAKFDADPNTTLPSDLDFGTVTALVVRWLKELQKVGGLISEAEARALINDAEDNAALNKVLESLGASRRATLEALVHHWRKVGSEENLPTTKMHPANMATCVMMVLSALPPMDAATKFKGPLEAIISNAEEIFPASGKEEKHLESLDNGYDVLPALSATLQKAVDKLFVVIDANKSLVLEYNEMLRAVGNCADLANHFREILDTNKNGEVDKDEWQKFFQRLQLSESEDIAWELIELFYTAMGVSPPART